MATNENISSNYSFKSYIKRLEYAEWYHFYLVHQNLTQVSDIKNHTRTIFNRTFFTINKLHNAFFLEYYKT